MTLLRLIDKKARRSLHSLKSRPVGPCCVPPEQGRSYPLRASGLTIVTTETERIL